MEKNIIFHIDGGFGKNIMATAVVKAMKKQYPDRNIIIVTAWEDAWTNNPNVHRIYRFGQQTYFFDTYIKGCDSLVFMHDPYHSEDYIFKKKGLIEIWCNLFGIRYNNEMPELFITPREIDFARNKYALTAKPIFLMQTFGGGGNQESQYSWSRDLPFQTAQDIADYFSKDYRVIQVKREDQLGLNGVEPITAPFRHLFIILLYSQKRLFIDSFMQHAAAAFGIPSIVTWVTNEPKVFGYDMHTNIISGVPEEYDTKKYSYLEPYNITGAVSEFPYATTNLFNTEAIIQELLKDIQYKVPYVL